MKILMISDVYFPRVNGVSTSIATFRKALTGLGHSVCLIAPDYGTSDSDDDDITRLCEFYDPTFNYFTEIGFPFV